MRRKKNSSATPFTNPSTPEGKSYLFRKALQQLNQDFPDLSLRSQVESQSVQEYKDYIL